MPADSIHSLLQIHSKDFAPVVPFNPGTDSFLSMDFTATNEELTVEILENTTLFTEYVDRKLKNAGARYGIGGYGELRDLYLRSRVFDAPNPGEEPRRFHLGTDIWGPPHTHVMAPLDGIVHSFAFNNNYGDYGPTMVLSHQLEGHTFYSLYGHLSLNDLKNLSEGQRIGKGDVFGEFGIPAENGQWPPHLHFQLILNMQGYQGDYPGVCAFSQREKYLINCPDPDLVLRMNRYAFGS